MLSMMASDSASHLKLVKLHAAISERKIDTRAIKRILEQQGDINYKIPNAGLLKAQASDLIGNTILHLSCGQSSDEIVRLLLDHGADVTTRNSKGQTVIHEFVNNEGREFHWPNHCEDPFLSAHLKYRITANPVDSNGLSHFHAACIRNDVKAIEFFLDNGVSVDQRVNVDSPIFAGYTPLHFATKYVCLKAVKSLLQRGANVDVEDLEKTIPLQLIVSRVLQGEVHGISNDYIDVIDELAKISTNTEDHFGLSRLHVLCTLKDSSRLERHLNENENVGCAVNAASSIRPGFTALHFAALFSLNNLKLLIAKGGDITIKDADEKTPLHLCIARYSIEEIHDILARSTCKDVTLSNGKTKLTDLVYSMRSPSHFQTFSRELGDVNAHIPVGSILWPGFTSLYLLTYFQEKRDNSKMFNEMIEECLRNGADVNAKGVLDQTPLQFALRLGRVEVVAMMLRHCRAASNPIYEDGVSPLHVACAIGDASWVDTLIANGADVNCKLGSTFTWFFGYRSSRRRIALGVGSTPLYIAVANCDRDMAKLLLQHGADPQARDADGSTAVHRSFYRCGGELCDVLLSSSELRECVVNGCGLSHLHVACYQGHPGAVKRLLLEPGVQVNGAICCKAGDKVWRLELFDGCTPLHMVRRSCNYENKFELVQLLLQRGADPLTASAGGYVPLYDTFRDYGGDSYRSLYVAMIRSDECLRRRVVERVAGLTDLHLACYERDLQWIGELLADGADVNAQIRDDSPFWSGFTPLHVLMKMWVKDEPDALLQLLLEKGADVAVSDGRRNSPLHLAKAWACSGAGCSRNRPRSLEIHGWCSHNDERTFPELPCDRASLMLRSIKDFTLNPTNDQGVSHFHIACECLDIDAVEAFLKHGLDVNARVDYFSMEYGGCTPLHLTLAREWTSPSKMKIVELLLKRGADVRAENYSGNTPLHYAAKYFVHVGLPIFAMIVDAGADMDAKNVMGASPVEILLKRHKTTIETIEYLISQTRRSNVFDCSTGEGLIPMTFSADWPNKKEVLKLFMSSSSIGENDELGRSAIHNLASTHCGQRDLDYPQLIEELEKLGCDVDQQDDSGQTALHAAARFDNDRAISALLDAGADINITDAAGKTAFAYSLEPCSAKNGDWYHPDDYVNEEAIELFEAQLGKLRVAGLHVNAANEIASRGNVRGCRYEIEKRNQSYDRVLRPKLDSLKRVKVGSQSLTLGDFMSENGRTLKYATMSRADREDVVEFFESILSATSDCKLGEARCLVRLVYRSVLARLNLVKDAKVALNAVANVAVPDLCSELILERLENWELRNVIAAAR